MRGDPLPVTHPLTHTPKIKNSYFIRGPINPVPFALRPVPRPFLKRLKIIGGKHKRHKEFRPEVNIVLGIFEIKLILSWELRI